MFFKSSLQQQWQLRSEGQSRWPGHGNCFSYPILHTLTRARAQTKQTELLWRSLQTFSPYLNKTKSKPFTSALPAPLYQNSGQKRICFLPTWGGLRQPWLVQPPQQQGQTQPGNPEEATQSAKATAASFSNVHQPEAWRWDRAARISNLLIEMQQRLETRGIHRSSQLFRRAHASWFRHSPSLEMMDKPTTAGSLGDHIKEGVLGWRDEEEFAAVAVIKLPGGQKDCS